MTNAKRILICSVSMLALMVMLASLFSPMLPVQARGGGSMVVSPKGMITDTTPTIKWYRISIATKYEYEVYKGSTLWQKITDISPSRCGTTYCTYTTSKVYPLASYKWRVHYYDGTTWSTWSEYLGFQVVAAPKDFDSQFNGSKAGWTKKPGAEWYVNSKYLFTYGVSGAWSSIYNSTSPAYGNFDFEVKMRRNDSHTNCLVIRAGSNFRTTSELNLGYPGYFFCFTNSGSYAVFLTDTFSYVTYLQFWTASPYIKINDWNKLRVIALGSKFLYLINGNLVYEVIDSMRSKGYVGIITGPAEPTTLFEVDYARLRVLFGLSSLPDYQISAEQQVLNAAGMLSGVEGEPAP